MVVMCVVFVGAIAKKNIVFLIIMPFAHDTKRKQSKLPSSPVFALSLRLLSFFHIRSLSTFFLLIIPITLMLVSI